MPFDRAVADAGLRQRPCRRRDASDVWTVCREPSAQSPGGNRPPRLYPPVGSSRPTNCRVDSLGRITAHITRGNVQDIILDLCDQLRLRIIFKSPVGLTAGIWVDDTDFGDPCWRCCSKDRSTPYYCEQGHLCLRCGAGRRAGIGDGRTTGISRRFKLEDAIPRGAQVRGWRLDLPRPEHPDPFGRPPRRGACRNLRQVGRQRRCRSSRWGDHHRRCAAEQHP